VVQHPLCSLVCFSICCKHHASPDLSPHATGACCCLSGADDTLACSNGCHALVQLYQRWIGLRPRTRPLLCTGAACSWRQSSPTQFGCFPLAVLHAYLNPDWSDWEFAFPNYFLVGYWCLATLMAYDCYSFFLHRWMHVNKAAFNFLHARHHASIAALDVNTASYMSAQEGCLVSGVPFLLLFAAGWATGNWWYTVRWAVQLVVHRHHGALRPRAGHGRLQERRVHAGEPLCGVVSGLPLPRCADGS